MVGKGFLFQSGLGNWRQSLVKCFQRLGGKGVWAPVCKAGGLGLEAGLLRLELDDFLPRSCRRIGLRAAPSVSGSSYCWGEVQETAYPLQGGRERTHILLAKNLFIKHQLTHVK